MKQRFWNRNKRRLTALSVVLLLVGLVALMTPQPRSRAASPALKGSTGIVYQTRLPFYDIRQQKEGSVVADLYRRQQERSNLSGLRAGVKMGEASLSTRVPTLALDYTNAFNTPELVGTKGSKTFLTAPASSVARESIVRGFLSTNKSLYGLTSAQISGLKTFADYTNPAGNMSFVGLKQEINGIPVFQAEVMASFTGRNELVRTVNNLAPGLNYSALATAPSISAADAVASAARTIGMDVEASDLRVEAAADGRSVRVERGAFDEDTRAELMYFPVGAGAAALSWSAVLWQPDVAYWTIIDAQTGQLLWRKCITQDQTQSVTYNVYNDDNPAPSTPSGATLPDTVNGFQGAAIARVNISVINEMPTGQTYSNDPWIADGAGNVVTTGNNADAGLDIDGTNGIDAAGRATGTGRVLSFVYNPAPGIPAPGDAPSLAAYRNGVVTNLFFWTNRYHDILYQYGFTEAARNFQTNNYGRGGLGSDFVRAESQDSSGTNNANFSTPGDGSLPRMQMYIFTGPNPDRDGDLDAEISVHEMTHGTSNRLHNNGSGLTTTQSGGMGEGWSDFYARAILSSASEDINGLYASGAYSTNQLSTLGNANYYYGIRRFPYALKTTLGPNGKPHNPLTYADIDTAKINTTDGAYSESPLNFSGNGANESHNIGEIWCMMLLEVRARIINRLGFAAGNARMLQITTDAMKLDVSSPTLIQARDSIIAADNAGFGGADVNDIWAGFATRGLGFGATTSGASTVTESFLIPNLVLGTVTFSDATTGNNNGAADPGETIALSVPLNNPLSNTALGATATIAGNTVSYGDINAGATVIKTINYIVPAATACGTILSIPVNINSSFGPTTQSFNLPTGALGTPVALENFDGVVAPALPAGWTTAATGSQSPWVSTTTNVDTAPNTTFAPDPTTVGNTELVTPNIPITTVGTQVIFRNLFNMEASSSTATLGWDGMVLEISIGGGAYQDILAAGGSFAQGGYTRTIDTAFSSPIAGRQAWSGLSGGTTAAPTYITTKVNLPAAASGQNIKLKFRAATDATQAASGQSGVRVDSLTIANPQCTPVVVTAYRAPYDFDGDNKSDISTWRGSDGLWNILQSSAPSTPRTYFWGSNTLSDRIVPADYDGDGKTDFAVYRNGTWYISKNTGGDLTFVWGASSDIPV
ncbi:MAG TPA: M36 family metallopeptidase, partial [Pyrinomonadaceae bacterium]